MLFYKYNIGLLPGRASSAGAQEKPYQDQSQIAGHQWSMVHAKIMITENTCH